MDAKQTFGGPQHCMRNANPKGKRRDRRGEPGVFSYASSSLTAVWTGAGSFHTHSLSRSLALVDASEQTPPAWPGVWARRRKGVSLRQSAALSPSRASLMPTHTTGAAGKGKKTHMGVGGDLDGSCAAMASTVSGSTPHSASRFGFAAR